MKVKVRSPDGDTDYVDFVSGVLQGNTLALYLFTICIDYVLRTSICLIDKITVLSWQRKEAEYTPHKLSRTRTTPII